MARSFFIETFGCQMNEHDSEKIAGLLVHRGLVEARSADQADVYLLNTCSVREKAAQKVYSRLGEFKARKGRDPGFTLGVVGCVAQQEGTAMVRKAPFVDLVVGTHLYHDIPDLLDEVDHRRNAAARNPKVAAEFLGGPAPVEIEAVRRSSGFRANITIMEGCNKRCSFCVVPFTRGRERNRPSRLIVEEARRAVGQGYLEILLLGQTVNSYRDPERKGFRFAELLDSIARIEGLKRIRFTSPHPREFRNEAIQAIAAHRNICNQIHLPLQSGSNAVLKRMRRQYTREWFLALVDRFRQSGRPMAFSTDMIVGFPGESEEDFQASLDVVREVEFESMFSFKYSPRPYTEALPWEDDVPEAEKTRRLMILQRLQKGIQLDLHRQNYLGKVFEVMVEGTARDGQRRFGRTATGKIVNFHGNQPAGRLVEVLISEAGPNSLLGETVSAASFDPAERVGKEPQWNANSQ